MSSFWVGAPRHQAFLPIRTSHVNNKRELVFFSEKLSLFWLWSYPKMHNLRHVLETSFKASQS